MEYKLIRSSRKTLTIKINENEQVIVLAPKKCSLDFINKFVLSKAGWIEKTKQNVHIKQQTVNCYSSLNKVILFGKELDVLDENNAYRIGEYYIKHSRANNKQKVIRDFFIKLANEYLVNTTEHLSSKLNLEYKSIKVISARKKWGSCNNLKEIKLNFRLIMLPEPLINYVICHELCHLKQMNHGKQFWALLEDLGYKKATVKQAFTKYNFVLQLL